MASRYIVPFSNVPGLWTGDPMLQLHREMNRLFDDVLRTGGSAASSSGRAGNGGSSSLMAAPRLDVHETDNELCVVAELPGVAPSEVDVRVDGDVLTLSGEKKNESEHKQPNYHVMERSYGRFQRSLQLPFSPDAQQIDASFDNGVLTVRIPKQSRQEGAQRIQVRSSSSPSSSGSAAGASSSGTSQGSSPEAPSSSSQSGSSSQSPASTSSGAEPSSDARLSPGADGRPAAAGPTGTAGGGTGSGTTSTHADLLSPDGAGTAPQQQQKQQQQQP